MMWCLHRFAIAKRCRQGVKKKNKTPYPKQKLLPLKSLIETRTNNSYDGHMIFKTKSAKETQKLAADLAQKTVNSKPLKHARVFALEGELGAGKTTFIQGFAKALKIKQKITSPTFVLMRYYKLLTTHPEKASGVKPRGGHATLRGPRGFTGYSLLFHIDAFRLKDWHDLDSLGIKDIFADPGNIILIEWAERVRPILPKKHMKIHIDHLGKNTRKITITSVNNLL